MDMQILKNVIIKEAKMKELNKKEMLEISGGGTITGSLLSALYKTIEVIYEVGESLGSYIRRKVEDKMCDI